jgi:alcohol dehydrogenase class IV
MAKLGLETRLRALGVSRGDLSALVRSVNEERLANNPRRLPLEAVGRVLESIY